jgi:endo-1,3-1,4-beta-glycanase ExoK
MRNRILVISAIVLGFLALAGTVLYLNWKPEVPEAPAVSEPAPAPVPEPDLSPAAPAAPADPDLAQSGEAFIDRFEGPELDPRWYVSDGWSNGDHMENDWRASRVSLAETGLVLTLSPAEAGNPKPFSSAEVSTLQPFRYGWFEFRVKIPKSAGLVSGLFSFIPTDTGGRSNEIDFEFLGRATRSVELAYHQNHKGTGTTAKLPFDTSADFHTYAFEWLPDRVRWYADGQLIHEVADAPIRNLRRPQKIIMHLWASEQLEPWVGRFDPSGGPWKLEIACVAYWPEKPPAALCN